MNQTFYIKYLDNNAVGINTHARHPQTFELVQMISTVSDLIEAVQKKLPKKLGQFDLDELSLHLPEAKC